MTMLPPATIIFSLIFAISITAIQAIDIDKAVDENQIDTLISVYVLIGVLIIVATASILLLMGRNLICSSGKIKLWAGNSPSDNSQHIADWYTLSHTIHGFLFYGVLWLIAGSWTVFGWRLLIAIIGEAAWEILENTDFVLKAYREKTISFGYTGDSVLNSVSDIIFMSLGFTFAANAPMWLTTAIAIFFELLTAYVIRDGLILNIVMLIYPIESIKTWQKVKEKEMVKKSD